ncbi:MAG: hypothetical protein ACK4ZM_02990 [bacterium]
MKKILITLISISLMLSFLTTSQANCKYKYQTYKNTCNYKKYSYSYKKYYPRYKKYHPHYEYHECNGYYKKYYDRNYYRYYGYYSYYYNTYNPYELILKLYGENYTNKNFPYSLIRESYNNIKITYYDSNEKNYKQLDY